MKTLITILVSIFFVSTIAAEEAVREIKISKEWKIAPNSTFELIAKNSDFRVEFWEKDNVRIDFVIKTNKADFTSKNFEEMLQTSASTSANKLSINTSLDTDKSSSIWNWIIKTKDKITKDIDFNNSNVIYLPKNLAQLNFNVNYGNLRIGEINIPLKISSSYGEASVLKNKNKTVITSAYTDMKLGDLSNLKLNSSYGDFIIDNIDTLISSTSYCDIKLSSSAYIQSLNTNYGDVTIQKTSYIKTIATYSDIKIKSLLQEVNAVLTYSDINIDDIAKSLKGITITSTYSDSKIKINPENPINVQIKDVNGDINIKNPRLQLNISKSENGNSSSITARTKTATDTSPMIKINSSNSDIIIY